MGQTILGLLLVAAILVISALITQLFARTMYKRCPECQTLNARRRTHCRKCAQILA